MKVACWLIVFLLGCCTTSECLGELKEGPIDLKIVGLFPLSGTDGPEGQTGNGVLPAAELAIKHINKNPSILQNFSLKMITKDTQCDMAVGTKAFFDAMSAEAENPNLMIFGDACTVVTEAIANAANYWNLTQLSYADSAPWLSERESFKTFFRSVPSDVAYNAAKVKLVQHLDWKSVGTIYHDMPRQTIVHNNFLTEIERAKIETIKTESFGDDPKKAVINTKNSNARIILGFFGEKEAQKVFCWAYKQNMYGSRYAWILPGGYTSYWWNNTADSSVDCTPEQIYEAANGYIATEILPLRTDEEMTVSGLSAEKYKEEYELQVTNGNYSNLHGYAYDGIWVIALAIKSVLSSLESSFDALLNTEKGERLEMFMRAMNETNFSGVTGQVRFLDGDRLALIQYKQLQDYEEVKIGEYEAISDSLNLSKGEDIVWKDSTPPRDQPVVVKKIRSVPYTLYIVMATLSSLGILLALVFLIINMKFRKQRYIKMSSPYINNLIIMGSMFTYGSIYILGLDGKYIDDGPMEIVCSMRGWLLACGFTLAYGAMFSKTWRVHRIFTNNKLKKRVISDYKLLVMVGVLLLIDFIIITAWHVVDPLKRLKKEQDPQPDRSGADIMIVPVLDQCVSSNMTPWLTSIYVYKGSLLLFGCFLAWEVRHVSIPALNDSKYIAMSVYNVVIMCVIGVALSIIIKDSPESEFGLLSTFIIFCTTTTLCLVFVPKILHMRRNPKGDEKFRCNRNAKTRLSASNIAMELPQQIKSLATEKSKLFSTLCEKEKELEDLLVKVEGTGIRLEKLKDDKKLLKVEFDEEYSSAYHSMAISSMAMSNEENYFIEKNPTRILPTISSTSETEKDSEQFGGVYLGPSENSTVTTNSIIAGPVVIIEPPDSDHQDINQVTQPFLQTPGGDDDEEERRQGAEENSCTVELNDIDDGNCSEETDALMSSVDESTYPSSDSFFTGVDLELTDAKRRLKFSQSFMESLKETEILSDGDSPCS